MVILRDSINNRTRAIILTFQDQIASFLDHILQIGYKNNIATIDAIFYFQNIIQIDKLKILYFGSQ